MECILECFVFLCVFALISALLMAYWQHRFIEKAKFDIVDHVISQKMISIDDLKVSASFFSDQQIDIDYQCGIGTISISYIKRQRHLGWRVKDVLLISALR